MSDDRWERFGEAAEKAGSDRTATTNRLAAWYMREDGAELPERPDSDPSAPIVDLSGGTQGHTSLETAVIRWNFVETAKRLIN